jgi:GAF domain-containing protein
MKKPSRAGGKPAKAKALKPKGRSVPKAMPRRGSAPAGQDTEVARLARERDEAIEQQTATANVLRVISSSPTDIQLVFDTIVRTASELCAAEYAILFRLRDGQYHVACSNNAEAAFVKYFSKHPINVDRGSLVGRTALERRSVHIIDCLSDPEYKLREAARLGKHRSMLGVPLLRDGEAIGVIGLLRTSVKPFTQKQIELVTTFAAQAVIAIENTRLLNELRQRTRDLTESFEQQTATSEVLRVVSSSLGDLQPVFDAMLANATKLCAAKFGVLWLSEGEQFRCVALHNAPSVFADKYKGEPLVHPAPGTGLRQLLDTHKVTQVADMTTIQPYIERDPFVVKSVELGGYRSVVNVPMLKETELIGAISIYHREVRPFTERQIELVSNFANQAVIAIENARLLAELRESLEEQTATAEVLQVISGSPADLQPLFEAMLEKAVRICDAAFGYIYRWDGSALHLATSHKTPAAYVEYRRRSPTRPEEMPQAMREMVETRLPVQVDPLASDYETNVITHAAVELGGIRTVLNVPMVKENELVGAFTVARSEVRPFNEKQIALVTNFARQAAIAIENARLLKELRVRTEEVEKLNQQLEQRVADQVGEIERMGRLRRFLPPQVADLIVASGGEKQLESHRREITALFCDLRGFTGFSEVADPEDVMALLRDYHAAIGEIIIKYSGTLERYAGDGVMVIFNDPVPVENPALQAVLMALEMRSAISALTQKWRRLGHDIGFGIGIAHGFATLGTIGFEGRYDYSAIGTVSNVASRLCDEARPGQILISPRVLMAVEDAVSVEPVGEFELKGIRRPIAAYNVLVASAQTH